MKTKIYSLILAFGFSLFYLSGQILCPAPTALVVSNITSSSANLTWTGSSTTSSYKISYSNAAASSPIWHTVTSSTNSATLTGLTANTTYAVKVQKVCASNGAVVYSDGVSSTFVTLGGNTSACTVPHELLAKEITASAAKLTWSPVSGAISYNVVYKAANASAVTTVNTTTAYLNIGNLISATVYEFKVQTVCAAASGTNTSAYSAIKTFTTLSGTTTSCGVPVELMAKEITSTSAKLTWNAVSGATSYNVVIKGNNGTATTLNALTTNHYLKTGLTAATNYEFMVQTVCGSSGANTAIYSHWSSTKSFTTLGGGTTTACTTPVELLAKEITSSSALLSWHAVSAALSYNIMYRAANTNNAFTTINASSNAYNITNLNPSTLYEFKVQTVCGGNSPGMLNVSAWSTIKNFTTTGGTTVACPRPTNLSSHVVSFNTVTVSWNSSHAAIGYNIQYKATKTNSSWISSYSNSTSKTLNGLLSNTTYEWKVQKVCAAAGTNSGLNSDWISGGTFTTGKQLVLGANPANSTLQLHYESAGSQQLNCTIHDSFGKVVLIQNNDVVEGSNEISIGTDAIENGIYFVQVKGSEGNQMMKFLIQH